MSEPIPEATPPATPAAEQPKPEAPKPQPAAPKAAGPDGFPLETPIADMAPEQQVAYWQHKARKHEDSAKANADKAARFDEFEEANKTELQKAADRAAAAEAKVAEIEARATRAEVAAAKGIPANLLSGATKEELEASADALIAFRGEKPKPDFGGGDRGSDVTAASGQLTEADVKKLSAEGKHAEIVKAKAEGRLADYLGSK